MDDELMKALAADGEKLLALTGEDHGPLFLVDDPPLCPICDAEGVIGKCRYCGRARKD